MVTLAEEVVPAIVKQHVEHWLRGGLESLKKAREVSPSRLPAVASHMWFEDLCFGSHQESEDPTFINLTLRSSRPRMHYVILENSLSGRQQRFWFDYKAFPSLGHLFDAATPHLRGDDDVTSWLVPLPPLICRSGMRHLVDEQIPLIIKYIKQQPGNWQDEDRLSRVTVFRQ